MSQKVKSYLCLRPEERPSSSMSQSTGQLIIKDFSLDFGIWSEKLTIVLGNYGSISVYYHSVC